MDFKWCEWQTDVNHNKLITGPSLGAIYFFLRTKKVLKIAWNVEKNDWKFSKIVAFPPNQLLANTGVLRMTVNKDANSNNKIDQNLPWNKRKFY